MKFLKQKTFCVWRSSCVSMNRISKIRKISFGYVKMSSNQYWWILNDKRPLEGFIDGMKESDFIQDGKKDN